MSNIPIKGELYQHFKGDIYRIIAAVEAQLDYTEGEWFIKYPTPSLVLVSDSIGEGETAVVYQSIKSKHYYMRSLNGFLGMIEPRPRFKKLGGIEDVK